MSALANRWFDPAELQWMSEQPDYLIAFLHLWTAKEAVGKALGQGLRNAGLKRRMPLPADLAHPVPAGQDRREVEREGTPAEGLALRAGQVPGGAGGLVVVHVPWVGAVVAVAAGGGVSDVLLTAHHGVALRRTVVSRTSFPVVVRGS
ncbi:4'-phosphopantetheinyl transferase superfamily protein [Kribbella pittospori]|uniref:4'-phosphopantetheinyl transferase superfamily protein n=1 Tax=Kribbella pittospori TaxID=722689 RepID=UPI003B5122A4